MAEDAPRQYSEQEQIRRDKLQQLTQQGRSPYAVTRFDQTHESDALREQFDALEGQEVSVAGRMISRRVMGKASFAHLLDAKGSV